MAAGKHEIAGYLASISSLMDSIDDAGATLRPRWLKDEYERSWLELKTLVLKEEEQRKREEQHQLDFERRRQEGRSAGSNQSGGDLPDRNDGGNNDEPRAVG